MFRQCSGRWLKTRKRKSEDSPEFMRAQLYTVPVSLRPSESPCRTADRQCNMDALSIQWELRSPCAVFDGYPLRNHGGNLCYPNGDESLWKCLLITQIIIILVRIRALWYVQLVGIVIWERLDHNPSEVNNSQIGVRKLKLFGGYIDEWIRVGINLWYYFWCYACGSQVYRFKKKEIDKWINSRLSGWRKIGIDRIS